LPSVPAKVDVASLGIRAISMGRTCACWKGHASLHGVREHPRRPARRRGAAGGGKVYRIAFLGSTSPSGYASQMEAFRAGLRDLGYVEGQNLLIEYRWAQGNNQLPQLAAELLRWKPDVLVTHGPPSASRSRSRSCNGRIS
jgi:hypothetical protein